MERTVTIIGAGMMGSALAFPLRENGHDVRLVGTPLDRDIIETCRKTGTHPKFQRPFPEGVRFFPFEAWEEAVRGADFVICGVSSFGVDWFLEAVLGRLSPDIPVLSVTKGLIGKEDGTLVSYPEYWQEALSRQGIKRSICAIGGPCTSYELVWHDQTEVAFCGTDAEALRMMKETMQTGYYHISLTRDVIGLESAVALKNAYALGVALTIGLVNRQGGPDAGVHFNSQAGAFYQAVREMTKLVRLQGGSEESLAIGIGDLYVTIYGGRTRRIGILLGEGKTYEEAMEILSGVTLESLVVAGRVARAIRKKAEAGTLSLSDFPLLVHADRVVAEGADASLPWEAFTFETL